MDIAPSTSPQGATHGAPQSPNKEDDWRWDARDSDCTFSEEVDYTFIFGHARPLRQLVTYSKLCIEQAMRLEPPF